MTDTFMQLPQTAKEEAGKFTGTLALMHSVFSSVGGYQHFSNSQFKLLKNEKTQAGSEVSLTELIEALREDRATECSQVRASDSFVKTIFGIKAFDDTIGAALTNGFLAILPTSYVFAGLGYVATDSLGYRVGGRNYQPLIPGQKSGNIDDATLYVRHKFDIGVKQLPLTLGNYQSLKMQYYSRYVESITIDNIEKCIQELQKQDTAQALEDLTNLSELLKTFKESAELQQESEGLQQESEGSQQESEGLQQKSEGLQQKIQEIDDHLKTKFGDFLKKWRQQTKEMCQLEGADIFFAEKLLESTKIGNQELSLEEQKDILESILNKCKTHLTTSIQDDTPSFHDQQIARIAYQILDWQYEETKEESVKAETIEVLERGREIASKRQNEFIKELNELFRREAFVSVNDSSDFYEVLNKAEQLKQFKDLFADCEHWATDKTECSDDLKTFLNIVDEHKKQDTKYLLTKDRSYSDKARDTRDFLISITTLGGAICALKQANIEHHCAEWGQFVLSYFSATHGAAHGAAGAAATTHAAAHGAVAAATTHAAAHGAVAAGAAATTHGAAAAVAAGVVGATGVLIGFGKAVLPVIVAASPLIGAVAARRVCDYSEPKAIKEMMQPSTDVNSPTVSDFICKFWEKL